MSNTIPYHQHMSRRPTLYNTIIAAGEPQTRPYAPSFSNDSSDDESDTVSRASSSLTDRVPSLTRASSISSSGSSVTHSEGASAAQGELISGSDDDNSSTIRRQDQGADLLCPFQILDCDLIFSSVRTFKIHVFSHFRGHPLPTTATCFLCPAKFAQAPEDDQALAWNSMLSHMAHEHFRKVHETGVMMRPDFALMRWMYDRKVIDEEYFKRAQFSPEPVMLPTAIHRRLSQASNMLAALPEAPTPPSPSSPTSNSNETCTSRRRSSTYGSRPSVTFASARAERRRRDSLISSIRYGSVVG